MVRVSRRLVADVPGRVKASAGINEKPRIEISADVKASTADGGFNTGDDNCKGIELGLSLDNEVHATLTLPL